MALTTPVDASRSLQFSYSEITSAKTCEAAHAFGYTGRLMPDGSTLRPKFIKPHLSAGSAWGAMVAAWHRDSSNLLGAWSANEAMRESLNKDAERMRKSIGLVPTFDEQQEIADLLMACFEDYTSRSLPLGNLSRLEDDLIFPIPSRSGKRGSSRYRYQARIDGFTVDEHEREWLWECKFLSSLRNHEILRRSRQNLWYAWSRQRETGRQIVGIIVDERLNVAPKMPNINKNGKVSHDKRQHTTAELYLAECERTGTEPDMETAEAFRGRVWQQRVRIPFRAAELAEAGRELTSAAKTVRQLYFDPDIHPMRIGQARICNSCDFRRICDNPGDDEIVDEFFTRRPPKHLAGQQPPEVADSGTPTPTTMETIPFR